MAKEWNFIADLHTHTIASDHAYSTVLENLRVAKERNLLALAITDHGPGMSDVPNLLHFTNLRVFPNEIEGVRLLKGIETNLLDSDGDLGIDCKYLKKLDWVIASFHKEATTPFGIEGHTQAYWNAIHNPFVDMLGHSGNSAFPYEEERIIKEAAACGKVIEVNESSSLSRPGSEETCYRVLSLCKKYHTFVCINSDAHFCYQIGNFPNSKQMLMELDFPKELVINADREQLNNYLKERETQKQKVDF